MVSAREFLVSTEMGFNLDHDVFRDMFLILIFVLFIGTYQHWNRWWKADWV